MTAITLHRIDPARNMQHFYRIDVQPDLFGDWCFICEWGRIGKAVLRYEPSNGHKATGDGTAV